MSSSASLPLSRELFADDISCKIAPRGACYALLCSAARRGVPPSPPTLRAPVNLDGQWDSARWGMKEPSLSLFAEPELFPGFYELCGCQRTVVNINNLNLTLVRPPPPQSHPMLHFSSERGEGTAPFIIQNGMANRTLCRTAAAATVLKAAQIPPRLIQSLSAAVE